MSEPNKEPSENKDPVLPIDRLMDAAAAIDEEIIGMASGDIVNRIGIMEKYNSVKNKYNSSFYGDLIYILTNIRLDEKRAREDWQNILKHKHIMSEKLGRNVGIRVATLDFFTNITRQITAPKIIDIKEYTKTVKESITDPLTFCYNRRYFSYVFRQHFLLAKETGRPLSLLMVDVDYFKMYNDQNGHIAGDFVLIEISRIFNVLTRKSDIVSRYGGEEFALLLNETGPEEALAVAEKIRKAIEDYRFPSEQNLPARRLTVSIGTATLADSIQEPLELIKKADEALYAAKGRGKNTVVQSEALGGTDAY
jgi:diguanylate cyclase (GGDEF)-like protein